MFDIDSSILKGLQKWAYLPCLTSKVAWLKITEKKWQKEDNKHLMVVAALQKAFVWLVRLLFIYLCWNYSFSLKVQRNFQLVHQAQVPQQTILHCQVSWQ